MNSAQTKARLVFFGSDPFAVPFLEQLVSDSWDIVAVFSTPAAAAGRRHVLQETAVAQKARALGLQVEMPKTASEIAPQLMSYQPDIAVVVAYGKIIPEAALAIPRYQFINVHPSLLPHYRGPSPIPAAILAGDIETGVSIMLLDREMDHGPILAQYKLAMTDETTANELESKLQILGQANISHILTEWIAGSISPQIQNHAQATYCKLLTRADGLIDTATMDAETVKRIVRALEPWPSTYVEIPPDQRIKILRVGKTDVVNESIMPGTFIRIADGDLGLVCAQNTLLECITVQPAGKRAMSGREYLAGHKTIQP